MRKYEKLFKSMIAILLAFCLVMPMNVAAFTGDDINADEAAGVEIQTLGAVIDGTDDIEGKCSSFYMGKDTTENGSYIWGRTEDYSASWRKLLEVHEAEIHEPGDLFVSSELDSNFTWPYPERTLRYLFSKDSVHNEGNGPEAYAEIGINEKNVAVTATVTLSGTKSAITGTGGNDRMVADGLAEIDLTSLVLMQAESAREACELLAEIVDEKGAAGREGTMIGDPNEIWYFQTLSGHQYVAVKCPDDKIGFSPNTTGNVGDDEGYIDITDTENVIASSGLIDIPKAAGTLVAKDDDTKIKIADSYASGASNHRSGRLRVGYGYLYGMTTNEEIINAFPVASKYLDYFAEPREGDKYSLYEAMKLLACRGEGTEWEAGNPSSNSTSIGNDRTQEAHVLETRPWMPDEIATVEWLAMGPAEFSVYLPYYGSLVTDVYKKYNFEDQQNYDSSDPYNNTMWHVFRQLYNYSKGPIGEDPTKATRAKYGDGVLAFWAVYQKSLIEKQAEFDDLMIEVLDDEGVQAAEELATEFSMAIAEETYEYAINLLEELKVFHASGAIGNFTPSAALWEELGQPVVGIRTEDTTMAGDPVDFIFSVANITDMMNITIVVEVDGEELSSTGFTALNGMKELTAIKWTQIPGTNRWEGTLTLTPEAISDGITITDKLDILKITCISGLDEGSSASMEITSVTVAAWDEALNKAVYVQNIIDPRSATTTIAKWFSKYDLDRNSVVDGLDLATAQRYYLAQASDADWAVKKIADINGDNIVDIFDLIEIFANFS